MPEINQLVLQNNDKSQDHITALAPFGSHLAVLMSHEYHRLSYVSQPIIDANVQVAAYQRVRQSKMLGSNATETFTH